MFNVYDSLISPLLKYIVLSFVDWEEAAADVGEVGTLRRMLVPAVTH